MNYLQLSDAIKNYTESFETSFVANIPRFIRQAEERIVRSVMIPELRRNATTTLTPNNPYLQRPTDFLSVFSLAVVDAGGNYNYLIDKDVNFMREAYPQPVTSGVPKYYSQFDGDGLVSAQGNFILAPTPSAAVAKSRRRITPLSSAPSCRTQYPASEPLLVAVAIWMEPTGMCRSQEALALALGPTSRSLVVA